MSTAISKPWKELKISGGKPATDIPTYITALGKPNCPRWDPIEGLGYLYDPGKLYSAAPKAVPLLGELLKRKATPNKDTILVNLTSVVCASALRRIVWGLNLEHADIGKFYARGVARDVWKETWAHRNTYVELLAHSDAMARSASAFLLAFDFEGAAEVLPTLEAVVARETEPKTKASQLMSIGLLRSYVAAYKPAFDLAVVASDASQDTLVRGAAVIGEIYASRQPTTLTALQRDVLVEWCNLSEVDADGYPWNNGETDVHCASVVEGRCTDGGIVAAEILGEAIRRFGPKRRGSEWAAAILRLAFEQVPDAVAAGPFMIDAGIREASEFNKRQTGLLDVLASYSFAAPFLSYGMPPEVYDRRRWLGLEPPGPLERVVEVDVLGQKRTWPIWRCLKAQQASAPKKAVDVHALLGNVLSEQELLEVRIEYAVNSYALRLGGRVGSEVLRRSHEMLPWAARYLGYISKIFNLFGGTFSGGALASLTAMEVLIKEGRVDELLPEYDVLIHPSWSEVLEAIPVDRREKTVVAQLQALLIDDARAMWTAGARIVTESTLKNLELYPTELVANALFDLRDHIESNDFTEFSGLCSAIERESEKIESIHTAFHNVVKRRSAGA